LSCNQVIFASGQNHGVAKEGKKALGLRHLHRTLPYLDHYPPQSLAASLISPPDPAL